MELLLVCERVNRETNGGAATRTTVSSRWLSLCPRKMKWIGGIRHVKTRRKKQEIGSRSRHENFNIIEVLQGFKIFFFFKFIARKLKRLCECYPVIGVRSSGRNFARIHCANYFNNTAICKPLVCKKTDTKLTIDISRPFDVFYE